MDLTFSDLVGLDFLVFSDLVGLDFLVFSDLVGLNFLVCFLATADPTGSLANFLPLGVGAFLLLAVLLVRGL